LFNKDVYPIPNISAIDMNVLGIKVLPGIDSDPNNLNISHWNVTSKTRHQFLIIVILEMDSRKIIIKLEFQTLMKVSINDVSQIFT
jgi:hypothetical protein